MILTHVCWLELEYGWLAHSISKIDRAKQSSMVYIHDHHHHRSMVMMRDKEIFYDQLVAMRRQEATMYSYEGLLAHGSRGTFFNVSWREKICRWSYNVADQ